MCRMFDPVNCPHVACSALSFSDGDKFQGTVTRIDVLHHVFTFAGSAMVYTCSCLGVPVFWAFEDPVLHLSTSSLRKVRLMALLCDISISCYECFLSRYPSSWRVSSVFPTVHTDCSDPHALGTLALPRIFHRSSSAFIAPLERNVELKGSYTQMRLTPIKDFRTTIYLGDRIIDLVVLRNLLDSFFGFRPLWHLDPFWTFLLFA